MASALLDQVTVDIADPAGRLDDALSVSIVEQPALQNT
jgi:hypothetical protein